MAVTHWLSSQRVVWTATACLIGHTRSVQDIGIVTSQTPMIYRPADGDRVYLTFEGLRESRTVAHKCTRIRITLSAQAAVHLWQQLADDVPAHPGVRQCHRSTGRRQSAKPGP